MFLQAVCYLLLNLLRDDYLVFLSKEVSGSSKSNSSGLLKRICNRQIFFALRLKFLLVFLKALV